MGAIDDYTKTVFDFLRSAEPGKLFTIDNLCKKDNRERFIDAVKLYISSYDYGGGVEFTADYTRIRILEIPWEAWEALMDYKQSLKTNKNELQNH